MSHNKGIVGLTEYVPASAYRPADLCPLTAHRMAEAMASGHGLVPPGRNIEVDAEFTLAEYVRKSRDQADAQAILAARAEQAELDRVEGRVLFPRHNRHISPHGD